MAFSSEAVPVGLVFLGGMVLTVLRRKAGHRQAQSQYPALAERLGLTHKPSAFRRGVGTLSGDFGGYSVTVDPDEQRRIRVRFHGTPQIDFRNYEQSTRAPHGMGSVYSADKTFDAYFKMRFAAAGERAHIESLKRPSALIEPLRAVRELKELSITQAGINCSFDYGNPSYIPVDVVAALVPALVALAKAFDVEGTKVNERASESDDDSDSDLDDDLDDDSDAAS